MNPSKIANTFAGERQMIYSNKTISNHIDYLADAFLISKQVDTILRVESISVQI